MSSSRVLAISKDEFKQMFFKCRPPTGWSNIIAVANSGGSDSTCLLFLLNRYLSDPAYQEKAPRRLVSISIDHDLQPSSASMAESCAKYARSLPGVEHMTAKVPWSTLPFPERPEQGWETIAREARYEMLFRCMHSVPAANVIAFAHHADDQVETALMRLGGGSTELGAAGMRTCRRWGMGNAEAYRDQQRLGWAGFEGMNKWIVRPLLDVGKDRILATCDENQLEFVTDESNFQPHITVRNAIRKLLTSGKTLDDIKSAYPEPLPPAVKEPLSRIGSAVSSMKSISADLGSGMEHSRDAMKRLAMKVNDIDSKVDRHLKQCIIPSPPGTLLLSLRELLSVHDDLVRIALIYRVTRYVSFHPWGSLHAEGKRKKKKRDRVLQRLWSPDPFENGEGAFAAGGGVLWTPVLVEGTKIKRPNLSAEKQIAGESVAWLISRQPPPHKHKIGGTKPDIPLRIDITKTLKQKLEDMSSGLNPPIAEILYDCRFLVRFDVTKIPLWVYNDLQNPEKQIRISIVSNARWYWPEVILENGDELLLLHSDIAEYEGLHPFFRPHETHGLKLYKKYWRRGDEAVVSEWVQVEWVRPLTNL